MDLQKWRNNPEIASLVEIGTKGFYPLFYPQWLHEVSSLQSNPFSKQEEEKAKKILKQLQKHKSLDRKKTLLSSLEKEDRILFIKTFLKAVEGKILDEKPELQ
ncbi:MAG: hypothetical protein VXW15_00650 [Bdellovibrionota bacterium]|nr:hypothetical protein [Bdellovibrionota bacterium]